MRQLGLFFNGFLLVVLGAVNTWQLAHEKYVDSVIVGFLTAFVWSYTVKKIAFGHNLDRFFYALGASLGIVAGLEFVKLIYH